MFIGGSIDQSILIYFTYNIDYIFNTWFIVQVFYGPQYICCICYILLCMYFPNHGGLN